MEFGKKLKHLREEQGLTQQELAGLLYVSRTAVSKWESGRGLPNLDSLRALAGLFSLPLDALLSDSALPQKETGTRSPLLFALTDLFSLLFLFLPLFADRSGGVLRPVPLLFLQPALPLLKILLLCTVFLQFLCGAALLILCKVLPKRALHGVMRGSLAAGTAGTLLFILGRYPYAAFLGLVFLFVKLFLCRKPAVTRIVSRG